VIFRHAKKEDVIFLTRLINTAYRGEKGWTTEADVLGGRRIDEAGLLQLVNDGDSFVFIAQSEKTILATLHAHREAGSAHFGLFAVEPSMQSSGVGKALLAYAESEVLATWKISTVVMEVITQRRELIEFYERRGYIRTDELIAFPESYLWEMKVESLALIQLKKTLKAYP
jgi:GNAT superfamily N-acetyltransferase